MKKIKEVMKKLIKKIEITDIIIFVIILEIWIYIAYMFAPGIMTSDSIDQWNQVHTGVFNDVHAPLHTITEWMISKIWDSPKAICIFQILLFDIIWTVICKKLRNKNKIVGILQIIGTVLIAIMPINYMYSVTLWKDVIYSYIILALIYLIYVGIKNNFKYTTLQIVLLTLFTAIIMKMRHNGIIIGIVLIPLLMIFMWKNTKSKKAIIKLVSSLIIFLVIIKLIYSCFDITYRATIMNKKWFTLYKIGVLYQNDAITDENDLAILEDIMPLDNWYRYTWDYTMNGLVFSLDMDYKKVNEHMDELWNMMLKYAIKNPKIMLKHYIHLTSVIWQLDEPEDGYTAIIQPVTYVNEGELAHRDNRDYMKIANKIIESMDDYKIIYRPAIYMYASIILVTLFVMLTKKKSYLLLVVPMIMNAISLIPAMTGQDVRYLYCNFLTFYFIIFAVIDVLRTNCIEKIENNKKRLEQVQTNNNEDKEPKVLIIVPAYNEEGAIKNTIEEIEKNNPKCDILVVNDASLDNTKLEIQKTKARVKVLDLSSNLGIGGAVQAGYLYAYENQYDIAIQVDGDGQHDSKYIINMVEEINKGYDMVIGSRFVGKSNYKQTFMRMLGINITSEIINIFTNKKITDTTSGFRAVNKKIIKQFAYDYPYDYPEPCTTMQMILKGYTVKEIPVEMRQRTTGVSSISPIKSIAYMFKVTLSLLLLGIKKN